MKCLWANSVQTAVKDSMFLFRLNWVWHHVPLLRHGEHDIVHCVGLLPFGISNFQCLVQIFSYHFQKQFAGKPVQCNPILSIYRSAGLAVPSLSEAKQWAFSKNYILGKQRREDFFHSLSAKQMPNYSSEPVSALSDCRETTISFSNWN